MKRAVILIFSVVAGWFMATVFAIGLKVIGLDIAAMLATSWSEYSAYSGAVILVLMISLGWVWYTVLARRFLPRKPAGSSFLAELPSWVRQPSVLGLLVAWVVAVFTVIVYPLAIYMSWRFYAGWRDGSKTCPRCAERIKMAAVACRHCGYDFQASGIQPATPTSA